MNATEMRKLLELSQEALAAKLGLDKAMVIIYEAWNPQPSYNWALRGPLAEQFALQVAPML